MPFTFSHPAVVLPLTFVDKAMFSVTALTIGSMTPDFGYFLFIPRRFNFSHTWSGILWFDLPLAIVIFYLYTRFVRSPLINHLPSFLFVRFARFKNENRTSFSLNKKLVILNSLLIGITSHVLWDKVTHKGAWLVEDPTEIYPVLWDASSVAGGLVIAFIIWKMPKSDVPQNRDTFLYRALVLIAILTFVVFRSFYTTEFTSLTVAAIAGLFAGLLIASFEEAINQK